MFLATVLTSVIFAQGAAPPAPPPPPGRPQEPQLEIGLYRYRANENQVGSTSNSGSEPFSSFMVASDTLCSAGGGKDEPASVPGFGWRVSGRIISQDGDTFAVQIDWARMVDHGVRLTNGPQGSSTTMMRLGDRLVLDRVDAGLSTCGVVTARLEAAMLIKTVAPKLPAGAGFNVGGGGARAGGSGGGGLVGVTGSVAVGRGTGTATGVTGGASTGMGVGLGQGGGGGSTETAAVALFDAALWLVHRQPDGTEDAQYQLVHAASGGAAFAFPPVTFAGPQGKITVELSGRVRPAPGVQPTVMLTVQLDRHVHVDSAPPQDARGNSMSTIVVAGPDDVVSFELPSAMEPRSDRTRDLLAGHQFSLRVRVAQK